MKAVPLPQEGVLLIEPAVHGDDRGFFYESFNQRRFDEIVGRPVAFVQDNHSRSQRGVLRGLHYQLAPYAQGKLVRAVVGQILDVAVDLRRSSSTFGQWSSVRLSADNKRMLWVPEGFAHGFLTLSEHAEVLYKATAYYSPDCERAIMWDDPDLAIDWGSTGIPTLSAKDTAASAFSDADLFK